MNEMSKPIFWRRYEKYFKLLSAEILTQHAKHLPVVPVTIAT